MNKPIITEKLVKTCELKLGNCLIIVNEYTPNLTKDQKEIGEIKIKNSLVKSFGNNEE